MNLAVVEFLLPLCHSSHLHPSILKCVVESLRKSGSIFRVGRAFLWWTINDVERKLGLVAEHQEERAVASSWVCTAVVCHTYFSEAALPLKRVILGGCSEHVEESPIKPFGQSIRLGVVGGGTCFVHLAHFTDDLGFKLPPLVGVQLVGNCDPAEHLIHKLGSHSS